MYRFSDLLIYKAQNAAILYEIRAMMRSLLLFFCLISSTLVIAQDIDYTLFKSGLVLKNGNNCEAAIKDFSTFLYLYPKEHPAAYYYRGYCYLNTKQYENAIADFESLSELTINDADGPFGKGRVYYAQGKYQEAAVAFSDALGRDPFYAHAYNDRGMSRCYLGEFQGAYTDFQNAIRYDSTFAMAYNNAGAAQYFNQDIENPSEADLNNAKQLFQKAIELQPGLLLAYRNKGAMHYFLKEYDAAIMHLDTVIKYRPNDHSALFYKGVVLASKGNTAEAEQHFLRVTELKPEYPFAFEELGNLAKTADNYNESKQMYLRAQAAKNESTSLYDGLMEYRIALLEAQRGNLNTCLSRLKAAYKQDVFTDKRVFKDFKSAPELKPFRQEKKMKKFAKKAAKGTKNNKFVNMELLWFRMRR